MKDNFFGLQALTEILVLFSRGLGVQAVYYSIVSSQYSPQRGVSPSC